MFRKILVGKDERALLLRGGRFVALLYPGAYRFCDPFRRLAVESFTLTRAAIGHRLADFLRLAEPALVAREFHDVQLGPSEIGLVYQNGALSEVLAPGARRLYWKGFIAVRVVRLDIADHFALAPSLTVALGTAANRARVAGAEMVLPVRVPAHHVGLLFVDGHMQRLLQPGLHAFWRIRRELRAELVDLRLQAGLLGAGTPGAGTFGAPRFTAQGEGRASKMAQATSTPDVVASHSISRPATKPGSQCT
jgi:hypothetical protein